MISTQLHHKIDGVDELVQQTDPDFSTTGLKSTSLVRVTRLAVVSVDILPGSIGEISRDRLAVIRKRLAAWILGD